MGSLVSVTASVELDDREFKAIMERVLSEKPTHTNVGVLGKKGKHAVGKARLHEFGGEVMWGKVRVRIPQRSFIRATVIRNQAKYVTILSRGMTQIIDGDATKAQILGKVGALIESNIRETIKRRIPPPLKQSTLDNRKRHGNNTGVPLIDRGDLIRSIDHEVR